MRCVLDTNLLVSGIIADGSPRRLLSKALAGEFTLCTSDTLLAELQRVLSRRKFSARMIGSNLRPQAIADDIRRIALVVQPIEVPRVVLDDPDDDHVVAAAVTGRADLIASGDKRHLLKLASVGGIPIVSASEAILRVERTPRSMN